MKEIKVFQRPFYSEWFLRVRWPAGSGSPYFFEVNFSFYSESAANEAKDIVIKKMNSCQWRGYL